MTSVREFRRGRVTLILWWGFNPRMWWELAFDGTRDLVSAMGKDWRYSSACARAGLFGYVLGAELLILPRRGNG